MIWHTMESAPRDGSYILAYTSTGKERHFHVVRWRVDKEGGSEVGYFYGGSALEKTRELEYWSPLIAPNQSKNVVILDPPKPEGIYYYMPLKDSWFYKWIAQPLLSGLIAGGAIFGIFWLIDHLVAIK